MSLWFCNCLFLMIISLVVGVWNLAKLHRPIQAGRLCTREGILRMITSQGLLVEHGGVTTEETPLGSFNYYSFIVLNRKADMEDLKHLMIIFLLIPSSFSFFLPDTHCPHQHNTHMPDPHNWNCPHKGKQEFLHGLQGDCQTPLGREPCPWLGLILTLLGLCGNTWLQALLLRCWDYNRLLTTEDGPGWGNALYQTGLVHYSLVLY